MTRVLGPGLVGAQASRGVGQRLGYFVRIEDIEGSSPSIPTRQKGGSIPRQAYGQDQCTGRTLSLRNIRKWYAAKLGASKSSVRIRLFRLWPCRLWVRRGRL